MNLLDIWSPALFNIANTKSQNYEVCESMEDADSVHVNCNSLLACVCQDLIGVESIDLIWLSSAYVVVCQRYRRCMIAGFSGETLLANKYWCVLIFSWILLGWNCANNLCLVTGNIAIEHRVSVAWLNRYNGACSSRTLWLRRRMKCTSCDVSLSSYVSALHFGSCPRLQCYTCNK